jgi:hypothetical protein
MDKAARNCEITIDGWRVEPIGGWADAPPETVEDAISRVVRTIEGVEGGVYYRSLHAVTYLTRPETRWKFTSRLTKRRVELRRSNK